MRAKDPEGNKFVVIGTTTADLIVHGMPAFAGLGDGFRADNLVFCEQPLLMLMGGNGGNSAYVLGRLGADTTLCSSIGQDDLGDWLVNKLTQQHVQLDGLLRQTSLATSSSTILLDSAENQAVFHHLGATAALDVPRQHEAIYAAADVLLASSYTLFPHMRRGGFGRALQLTHENGGITALDIGPAIGEPVSLGEIAPLFPQLDYLIANAHELMVCTGTSQWEAAAEMLLAQGCRCVVIKQGSEGVALRSDSIGLDVPAFEVTARIGAGAGDSFNAGFLYALVNGPLDDSHHLETALRFGSATAALVVSGHAGVLSAPTRSAVQGLLENSTVL